MPALKRRPRSSRFTARFRNGFAKKSSTSNDELHQDTKVVRLSIQALKQRNNHCLLRNSLFFIFYYSTRCVHENWPRRGRFKTLRLISVCAGLIILLVQIYQVSKRDGWHQGVSAEPISSVAYPSFTWHEPFPRSASNFAQNESLTFPTARSHATGQGKALLFVHSGADLTEKTWTKVVKHDLKAVAAVLSGETNKRSEYETQMIKENAIKVAYWLSTAEDGEPVTSRRSDSLHSPEINENDLVPNSESEGEKDSKDDYKCSPPDKAYELPILVRSIFCVFYAILFCVGMTGNVLTICATIRKGRRATAVDISIASLALSDIILCIFTVSTTPVYMLVYGYWRYGLLPCRLVAFGMSESVYVSTLTMANIAYYRYRLIVNPHFAPLSTEKALLITIGTWFLAGLISWPYLSHVTLVYDERCEINFCGENWGSKDNGYIFSIVTFVVQLIIPTCVTSILYYLVSRKLYERNARFHQPSCSETHITQIQAIQREPHSAIEIGLATSPESIEQNRRVSNLDLARTDWTEYEQEQLGQDLNSGISASATMPRIVLRTSGLMQENDLEEWIKLNQVVNSNIGTSNRPLTKKAVTTAASSIVAGARQGQDDIIALKNRRARDRDRRYRQTNMKLILMVVLFVCAWLPLNTFNLVIDCYPELSSSQDSKIIFMIVHVIASSSVCYNPILYAWMSENYRQELQNLLPKFMMRLFGL